ncbi:MAG: RDD family protein [Bacilli bacterium]
MEASFIHRFVGYTIDILIITVISSLIMMILPPNKNIVKLNEELNKITEEIVKNPKLDEKILNRVSDINYDLTKETYLMTIIDIVVALVYFVIIPVKNNGQTVGKRLLHIKTVNIKNEPLTYNNLLLRYLIINAIAANIILLIIYSICSKNIYISLSNSINIVQSLLMIVTITLVMFRKDKRGLHDFLGNTKVVYDMKKELVECKN